MKNLFKGFSIKEVIIISVLLLFLLGVAYYQFVDSPVRSSLESAASEKESLNVELTAVRAKIAKLEKMKNEIDNIQATGAYAKMPSYDNSKEVYKLLNDVLGDMGYTITFSSHNRKQGEDTVRWNITLSFTAPDRATVKKVMKDIAASNYRCLISDMSLTPVSGKNLSANSVSVTASITFYETMVGATTEQGING
ncbi:MAG: hypothetical protein IKQ18_06840 [Clostridia bacterium]|jgi:predicted butyrate kinase (DUF1464 family)|nr:hypothetical protein [Clostridia bacterium]